MNERYIRLFKCPAPQAQGDAPVLLAAGVLLGDKQTGNVLAQLKMQNISQKEIKVVYASLLCKDAMNTPLEESVDVKYMDLQVHSGDYFADRHPILIANTAVRSFSLQLTAVMFADGTTWKASGHTGYELLPDGNDYSSEQIGQLRYETGNTEFCMSEMQYKANRRCCCGQWNLSTEKYCVHCGADFEGLAPLLDPQQLMDHYNARIKAEEEERLRRQIERERKLAEEKRQRELRQKQETERLAKEKSRRKKTAIILTSSLTIVAVLAFATISLVTKVILPASHYKKAESLRDTGEWDAAAAEFAELGEYKDAAEQVFATYYTAGEAKRAAGDWDGAVAAFTSAGEYSDAAEQVFATYYAEGEAKRDAGDWDGAVVAFTNAGNYKGAIQQGKEISYAAAEKLLEAGNTLRRQMRLLGRATITMR